MQPERAGISFRQVRRDRQTLRGAVALGAGTLGLLVLVVGLAWLEGLTRGLPAGVWILLVAVFVLLLSLELLFIRDYRRLRPHAARPGPRP